MLPWQSKPKWQQQLDELLSTRFAGHGGQKALAEALGVSYSTLKKWLAGEQAPSYENRWIIQAEYDNLTKIPDCVIL